MLYITQKSVKD